MKKAFTILLALVLLLTAGCSKKAEQPETGLPETRAPETTVPEPAVPETTVPETMPPETAPPQPKLETGTAQGDNIPAILYLLNRGDPVEVTGYAADGASVKTDFGTGTMDAQLLRFAGEEIPESWTAYARWNTGFYPDYEMGGRAPVTLRTNTRLEVLEELEGCYLVTAEGQTGFVSKAQVSKWPVQPGSVSPGSQDGGNIDLAYYGNVRLLSNLTQTGSASVRVDGARVILKYFNRGDTVQLVAEEGFAPELPGYLTILVEGTYAYIPELWVHRDGEPAFEGWEGFAGYNCWLYDNYQLKGTAAKQLYSNTPLTVLWTAGEVSVIRAGDTIGYAFTDTLRTARIPTFSSDGEWTPPIL